ncbi:MAG: hypothetical protein P4M15_09255 [Alphaproteobacteria bacterium]|nr:hypothetical protein [Alphaproteobacteria bacterium]
MTNFQHRALFTALGALALGVAATAPASAQKLYATGQSSSFIMETATVYGHSAQPVASDRCGIPNGAEILSGFDTGEMPGCHR